MIDDEISREKRRLELEGWFHRGPYVSPLAGYQYGPSRSQYEAFRDEADRKVLELIQLWDGTEQICEFLDQHIQGRFSPYQRIDLDYWTDQLRHRLPEHGLHIVLASMQKSLVRARGGGADYYFVGRIVGIAPDHDETFARIRDYFLELEEVPWTDRLTENGGLFETIAELLVKRYHDDPETVWPLIRTAIRHHPGFLGEVWGFDELRPNRKLLAEDALAKVRNIAPQSQGSLDKLLEHYADAYKLETCHDLLVTLALGNGCGLARGALFALCAYHRRNPNTMPTVLSAISDGWNYWVRTYAFQLAFFYYYDNPKAAKTLVETVDRIPQQTECRRTTLASQWKDLGILFRGSPLAREVASPWDRVDRTKVFIETCEANGFDYRSALPLKFRK